MSLIQTPADEDLSRFLAILLHKSLNCRLIKARASHNRAIGFDKYTPLVAPVHDIFPREPWVHFHLVNAYGAALACPAALGFQFADVLLQLVQVVHTIVADSDGADFAVFHGLDKLKDCELVMG